MRTDVKKFEFIAMAERTGFVPNRLHHLGSLVYLPGKIKEFPFSVLFSAMFSGQNEVFSAVLVLGFVLGPHRAHRVETLSQSVKSL